MGRPGAAGHGSGRSAAHSDRARAVDERRHAFETRTCHGLHLSFCRDARGRPIPASGCGTGEADCDPHAQRPHRARRPSHGRLFALRARPAEKAGDRDRLTPLFGDRDECNRPQAF